MKLLFATSLIILHFSTTFLEPAMANCVVGCFKYSGICSDVAEGTCGTCCEQFNCLPSGTCCNKHGCPSYSTGVDRCFKYCGICSAVPKATGGTCCEQCICQPSGGAPSTLPENPSGQKDTKITGSIPPKGPVERDDKEKDHKDQDKDEEKGGFIKMVTDSIHDIGKKIEGAIGFGKPTASISEIDIPKIDLERAEIVVDVLITNPHPDPISLIISIYLIESEGRKLISGLIPHDGTIKPHGSETVKISVTLIYDDIKNTYDDIKPGSIIPYEIKVDLIVVVPVIGRIAIPLEKEGKIPIPPCKLDIDVKKIHFQTSSSGETVAILHLKLENKYDFDLGIVSLVYTLSLAGQSIQDKKNLESTNIVKKSGASSMEIPITFKDPSVLRGKAEVSYTMEGHIEVDRPFGRMKLPISKEGGTTQLKNSGD